MQFRMLGPLDVLGDDGRSRAPNRRKQRVLLALLLTRANTAVSNEYIVDALWGEDVPRSAASNLQSYIAGLRALLQASEQSGRSRLESQRGAYVLSVGADELDVVSFERLLEQGRAALRGDDAAVAVDRLDRALGLWRGQVLQDLDLPAALRPEAARLEELRLTATEDSIEARLATGALPELAAELEALVQRHPLRERLWGHLMLVLYRCGRQADALAAFRRVAALLDEELGVAPGPELQRLHRRILAGDRTLDGTTPLHPALLAEPGRKPRQLPADVPVFAGRREQLAALDALLSSTDPHGAASVVVAAVSGAAGVGKTALAVHWCHRVSDRFPDGQLYVNLRGWAARGAAVSPAQALSGFLAALDVPASRVPRDFDAQAALYRSILAGKRMLVALDNALDAEQVRPLLPGSPGFLVVVTSRNRLSGLVAVDGAYPITLDPLTAGESRELLARRLGRARVAAEQDAVRDIVDACGGLPLALNVVSARAAGQAGFPLAVFADQLRDSRTRLDALDAGEAAGDVRSVLSWSYQSLSSEAARALRLIATHSGRDISVAAVASLIGRLPHPTRSLLAELAGNHLVTEHVPGRYLVHDLLRAYAAEEADRVRESVEDERLATHRLLDHYLHTAYAATLQLNPARDPLDLAPPQPGVTLDLPTGHDEALSWFTSEHAAVLDAIDRAARTDFDMYTWRLAWTFTTFLERRGFWHDYLTAGHAALAATRRLDDAGAEARIRGFLARMNMLSGHNDDAREHLRRAGAAARRSGDRLAQAYVAMHSASLSWRQDRTEEALADAGRALDLFRDAGYHRGEAAALNSIAWYHSQRGDHRQALTRCKDAIGVQQQIGDRHGEAGSWDTLGYAHRQLGCHDEAVRCFQRALQLVRDLGDRYHEAAALSHLAETHEASGRPDDARDAWRQALTILDELEHDDADQVRDRLRGYGVRSPA